MSYLQSYINGIDNPGLVESIVKTSSEVYNNVQIAKNESVHTQSAASGENISF